MKVNLLIEKPIDLKITEARLLTKEEVEVLPSRLRLYNNWWWTNSAILEETTGVWGVQSYYGPLTGSYVNCHGMVRPVLIFESTELQIGNHFFFGNKEFEVISDNLAFCLSDIGYCKFRENHLLNNSNQYEVSDIKKYINNWFEENCKD